MKKLSGLLIIFGLTFASLHSMRPGDSAAANTPIVIKEFPGEVLSQGLCALTNHLPGLPKSKYKKWIHNPITSSIALYLTSLFGLKYLTPLLVSKGITGYNAPNSFHPAQNFVLSMRCSHQILHAAQFWITTFGVVTALLLIKNKQEKKLLKEKNYEIYEFVKYISDNPHVLDSFPTQTSLVKKILQDNFNTQTTEELTVALAESSFFKDHDVEWNKSLKTLSCSKTSRMTHQQHKHNLLLSCYITTFVALLYFLTLNAVFCP